jgi:hypothetical protein
MLNILFIFSDSRIATVVETLRGLTPIPICVASDYDTGLQDIFEKRPQLIFMQEEIEGHACASLAGHIKILLRDNAPRIVLLRDDPNRKLLAGRDSFDDAIDLCGLTDDLLAAICLHLETVPGMQWRADALPSLTDPDLQLDVTHEAAIEQAAAALLASVEEAPAAPVSVSDVPAPFDPTEAQTIALAAPFAPVEAVVAPPVPEPVATEIAPPVPFPADAAPVAAPATQVKAGGPVPSGAKHRPVTKVPPRTAPVPPPIDVESADEETADEFAALESVFALRSQRQKRTRQYVAGAGVLLALVLLAGWYFLGRTPTPRLWSPPPSATAVTPTAPALPSVQSAPTSGRRVPAPMASVGVPPFLASATPDAAYGQQRPGWERRTAAGFEALIYREGTQVRAVQVIARDRAGLADQVIADLLQFAGGTAVAWQREEKSGDLHLDHGVLPNRTEVLRYRRPGSRAVAALVVAIP